MKKIEKTDLELEIEQAQQTQQTQNNKENNSIEEIQSLANIAAIISGTSPITEITISDSRVVQLKKCKTKHLGAVMGLISLILKELQVKSRESGPEVGIDLQDMSILLSIFSKFMDDIALVVAKLSSVSKDEFMELEIDDSISIALGIFQLNKDFFSKHLLPILRLLGLV